MNEYKDLEWKKEFKELYRAHGYKYDYAILLLPNGTVQAAWEPAESNFVDLFDQTICRDLDEAKRTCNDHNKNELFENYMEYYKWIKN